jgi:hypothetical protein
LKSKQRFFTERIQKEIISSIVTIVLKKSFKLVGEEGYSKYWKVNIEKTFANGYWHY